MATAGIVQFPHILYKAFGGTYLYMLLCTHVHTVGGVYICYPR